MGSLDRIYTLADDLLEAAAQSLTSAGLEVPDRRFVSAGEIAFDCDQLAVELVRVYPGLPGAEITQARPKPCFMTRTSSMIVWLIRCAPGPDEQGNPPESAAIDEFSLQTLKEMQALLSGIIDRVNTEALAGPCEKWFVGVAAPAPLEGLMGGVRLNVDAQLV